MRSSLSAGVALCVMLVASSAVAQDGGQRRQQAVFDQLDRNGDGVLTRDEIDEKQLKAFQRLLRVGDEDDNGELARQEFLEALQPLESVALPSPAGRGGPNRRPQVDPARLFQRLDRNNDQKLTLDELPAAQRERFKRVFERLGKDALTVQEFRRVANLFRGGGNPSALFDRLDRNNDGKLTKAELPAPLQRRFEPLFQRLDADELTREQFVRAVGRRSRQQRARVLFDRLDRNGDEKLTADELPEQLRRRLQPVLERLGKESLEQDEFVRAIIRRGERGSR